MTARQGAPIALDVTLACEAGHTLALVGPSGSGKTTVLRTIAGLYTPTHARVTCRGATWTDTAARIARPVRERPVGIVFQQYALFPHLTAEANVACALEHLPPRERRERARRLLAQVHLEGLEGRRPHALSGGQQQRVAMARALARDPQVLLLDEPFSAVDKVTRRRLYLELADLKRTLAMPVVLVTHDLEEAAMLADTMTILHRGRTLQSGAPHAVLTRPASVEVARLVDLANLHPGTLVADAAAPGGVRLAWAGHALEIADAGGHRAGEEVWWSVPADGVILHRVDRPSRGERENPVPGVITSLVALGAQTSLALEVGGHPHHVLRTTLSTHVAERNGLATGRAITVSLLASALHVMPAPRSAGSAANDAR